MSMSLKKKVRELTGDDATQSTKIAALEAAVGSKDTDTGSLKKRCKDIETSIANINEDVFNEDEPTSITARITALEHAAETSAESK